MNLIFIGKPGSGKGTLSQQLKSDNYIQLSTGDLLREEVALNTDLGKKLKKILAVGGFADDNTVIGMVDTFIKNNSNKNIIFDGFPRNLKQAEIMVNKNIKIDAIIYFDVSDDVVIERIINRRVHLPSGRVYNIKTLPPKVENKDDITGEQLTQRDDDKLEVITSRIETFNKTTQPISEFLQSKSIPILVLNTDELSIKEQYKKISYFVKEIPKIKNKLKLKLK